MAAADPDMLAVQEILVQTASPVLPALLELPDVQVARRLSARKSTSHRATHAHLAHLDRPDRPAHLATLDDQDPLEHPETTDSPDPLDRPARTDHLEPLEATELEATQADQHRALPTALENPALLERAAHQVSLATTVHLVATDSLDQLDRTDHLVPPVPEARMERTARPVLPDNRARKENAVSAPSTAPWTAECSSKTERDVKQQLALIASVLASFIDILHVAVILHCHQSVSR